MNLKIVEDTWAELGFRIRPMKGTLIIRTEPHTTKTAGGIWLSPKYEGFYGDLPHLRVLKARVLAVGPDVKDVKVGDRIALQRLHFARYAGVNEPECFVGWVQNYKDIYGHVEEDECAGTTTDSGQPQS